GNDKPNLIHVFAKSLAVVVELRFDIKNKPVQIICITIKGTDIEAIRLVWSPLFLERFQLFRSRCITCPSDSSSASLSDELLPESSEESDVSGPPPGAEAPCLLWFPRGERDLDRRAPVFCGGGEGGLPRAAPAALDSPPAGPIPSPAI